MNPSDASAELLLQIRHERDAIERELESLAAQNERLFAAASKDTLSGHLRQAVHASRRPLADIARETGIAAESLYGFLEGEHGLPSEALDQLARAAGVVVSLSRLQDKGG
jgi:DNA-binding phage protein